MVSLLLMCIGRVRIKRPEGPLHKKGSFVISIIGTLSKTTRQLQEEGPEVKWIRPTLNCLNKNKNVKHTSGRFKCRSTTPPCLRTNVLVLVCGTRVCILDSFLAPTYPKDLLQFGGLSETWRWKMRQNWCRRWWRKKQPEESNVNHLLRARWHLCSVIWVVVDGYSID